MRDRAFSVQAKGAVMKIGIIGAGNVGGTLVRKLSRLGHSILVANSSGPNSLVDLVKETGARASSVTDAVKGVDLVIVTIPLNSVPLLPEGLFRGLPDTLIVVDTCNYYPSSRDGHIAEIDNGMTESVWVAQHLGRPVLKAFNNIMAQSLSGKGLSSGTKGRIAAPVSGDDQHAKEVLIRLIDTLGFDGIDAGSIDESWRQQPGTPVYCTDLDIAGVRRALSQANRVRSPELREAVMAKMQLMPANSPPNDTVLLMRSVEDIFA